MAASRSERSDGRLSGRRVAVTGAAGFLGSHVVPLLLAEGAAVVAIDAGFGRRPILRNLAAAGAVEVFDAGPWPYVVDDRLAATFWDCDSVVHLAFRAVPGDADRRAARLEVAFNLQGTLDLLDALGPATAQLCFASSAMVYDPRRKRPQREREASPATAYGTVKLATEQLLSLVGTTAGMAVTNLRFSTLYGRWDTAPRAVPNFVRSLLAGEPIEVRGGADTRDYLHVDDAAAAVVAALGAGLPGTFNVGTGVGTTTAQLAHLVSGLGEHTVRVRCRDDDRPAVHLVCDATAAAAELGFSASTPLRRGLGDVVSWTAEHGEDGS